MWSRLTPMVPFPGDLRPSISKKKKTEATLSQSARGRERGAVGRDVGVFADSAA
jgi:hypothetical protein